jgi:hypothetical protein
MSEAEQLLLARRLKANPCHVTSLSVCGNCTIRTAQREMLEAIRCMTALQTLNLSSKAPFFVVLIGDLFCGA